MGPDTPVTPFGYPWEALAARVARGEPLPEDFVRAAAAAVPRSHMSAEWLAEQAVRDAEWAALPPLSIPGVDDHLVPRHLRGAPGSGALRATGSGGPRSPMLRMPAHDICDVDGVAIGIGDRVLYAGQWNLVRATVVRLREWIYWRHDRRIVAPRVYVRQDDGRTVTILRHMSRILVLTRSAANRRQPTEENTRG